MKKILFLLIIICSTLIVNAQEICQALTKKGVQCTRKVIKDGYCMQHYNLLHKDAKILAKPHIDLPEEWEAISQDPKSPDIMVAWYDKATNTIYLYYKH